MLTARFRSLLLALPLASLAACSSSGGGGPAGPGGGTVVPPPSLLRIDVDASATSLPKGAVVQLTATGTYSDGATQDLTRDVAWSTLAPEVVEVSGAPGAEGLATGLAPGAATVRAETPGGLSATVELVVTEAVLSSIALAGPTTLPLGVSAPLVATGTFSDGSQHAVTHAAAWTSTNAGVLAVSSAAGSRGFATALALGSAAVVAQSGDVTSPPLTIAVTAAVPELLSIEPVDPSIGVGSVVNLAATMTYSDDTEADFTGLVTWSSSAPLVASVGSNGAVTGLAGGTAVVTARHEASGLEATTTVEVTASTAPALSYVWLSRGSVLGGATLTGKVVLTRAAVEPVTVALSSSDPAVTVPPAVAVPAGEVEAVFDVETVAPTRRKLRVVLSATYDEVTKTAAVNLRR